MTYLVRNYNFGKARRIDLQELGVVLFKAKQHLGIIHDENIAKALAALDDVNVVRRQSSQNSGIPELEIVNAKVPIEIERSRVTVEMENALKCVQPQVVKVLPDEQAKEAEKVEVERAATEGMVEMGFEVQSVEEIPIEEQDENKPELKSDEVEDRRYMVDGKPYQNSPFEDELNEEHRLTDKDDSDLSPFCGCGCEKRVTNKGNKFLRGHHLRKSK